MRIFCVVFLWVGVMFLPVSDASFYKLKKYRSSVGLTFSQLEQEMPYNLWNVTTRSLGLRLDYGYADDIKLYFIPGLSFTDTGGEDIPPSPTAGAGVLHFGRLSGTKLEYYIGGAGGVAYQQIRPLHFIGMQLGGYIGLLARLGTDSALKLVPFCGVHYNHAWINVSTTSKTLLDDTDYLFNGSAGIEVEISPSMSVMVEWAFSFQETDSLFTLQVNFH